MEHLIINLLLFMVLAALAGSAAFAQGKVTQRLSALGVFTWASLMFMLAGTLADFKFNVWYGVAAQKMLNACISGIESGRHDLVLREMRQMESRLKISYEWRGNFRELAEKTAKDLEHPVAEQTGPTNESQPIRLETNSTSPAAGSRR